MFYQADNRQSKKSHHVLIFINKKSLWHTFNSMFYSCTNYLLYENTAKNFNHTREIKTSAHLFVVSKTADKPSPAKADAPTNQH